MSAEVTYSYYVSGDSRKPLYDGPDAADAMAAWSRAVSDGEEYVFLEALRDIPKGGER